MSKTSFFHLNDYKSELASAGHRLGKSPRLGLVVLLSLACVAMLELPSRLVPSQGPSAIWGALLGFLGLLVLFFLQVILAETIRKDQGLSATVREGWSLMGRWFSQGAWLGLLGLVLLAPLWLPAFGLGVQDGLNRQATEWGDALWPGNLVRQVYGSIAFSVLGGTYLWLFPLAVFHPDETSRLLRRQSRRLAWRTWPLGLGFGVLGLVLSFTPSGGWADLVSGFQALLGQAFFLLQLFALAPRSGGDSSKVVVP